MCEGTCNHCQAFASLTEVGRWLLCDDCKDLKQYALKQKKTSYPKRTPIKRSQKKIRQISVKQGRALSKYSKVCASFKKKNPLCTVRHEGCHGNTSDIHHSMGKVGYADKWARENDVPLLIDERHFVATCRSCHDYIEHHPSWAREKGFSKPRIEKS